jgi:hypothetical protein
MDLIVRNVRLAERPADGPVDVGVAAGRIVAIAPGLEAPTPREHDSPKAAEIYDAGGRLACAGLVETHIHLDKSRIIDRCPPPAGRAVNPVAAVAPLKAGFTGADVHRRAERTSKECLMNGATRMRTQVEVDPAVGLRGFEAVRALAADYAWAIDAAIARMLCDADKPIGGAAETAGLRTRCRQPGRYRRHRRRNAGRGGRRDPPAAGRLQTRPPHRHPPPAGAGAAGQSHPPLGKRASLTALRYLPDPKSSVLNNHDHALFQQIRRCSA